MKIMLRVFLLVVFNRHDITEILLKVVLNTITLENINKLPQVPCFLPVQILLLQVLDVDPKAIQCKDVIIYTKIYHFDLKYEKNLLCIKFISLIMYNIFEIIKKLVECAH